MPVSRRTKLLQVRVNGEELDSFREAAALCGLSLSDWARSQLANVLRECSPLNPRCIGQAATGDCTCRYTEGPAKAWGAIRRVLRRECRRLIEEKPDGNAKWQQEVDAVLEALRD